MKIERQYEELKRIQGIIDLKLGDNSFESIRELVLFLDKDDMFNKLKLKDNKLGILNIFVGIWLAEKTVLNKYGIETDIFTGISSLADIEYKYHVIEFGVLRIENNLPDNYQIDAIRNIINMKISGIAIANIIKRETKDRINNVLRTAKLLKKENDFINAILLLKEFQKLYANSDEVKIELADTYIAVNCLKEAYDVLVNVNSPDDNILAIIDELKGII